jgi:hypothetical protein
MKSIASTCLLAASRSTFAYHWIAPNPVAACSSKTGGAPLWGPLGDNVGAAEPGCDLQRLMRHGPQSEGSIIRSEIFGMSRCAAPTRNLTCSHL